MLSTCSLCHTPPLFSPRAFDCLFILLLPVFANRTTPNLAGRFSSAPHLFSHAHTPATAAQPERSLFSPRRRARPRTLTPITLARRAQNNTTDSSTPQPLTHPPGRIKTPSVTHDVFLLRCVLLQQLCRAARRDGRRCAISQRCFVVVVVVVGVRVFRPRSALSRPSACSGCRPRSP